MADIEHKARFFGGMTSDTHPRAIQEGDYVRMLNMRNSKVEGNQHGGAVNVRGNVLIPFTLPVGENECIGSLEDKQKQRIYYWVWNSLGNHQFLRYDIPKNTIELVLSGDLLKLNREWLITQSSITDGKYVQWGETKVTGLDVVGNPPRYIDAVRAVLTDKNVILDILVRGDDFNANTTSYGLIVNTPTGQFGISLLTGSVAEQTEVGNKAQLYKRLKDAINDRASNLVEADDCGGCRLEIRSKVKGNVWVQVVSSSERFFTVPQNRYHRDLDETSIKLGRLVPTCQPTVELIQDDKFNQNFIRDRFFQFQVRYVYWDGQKSSFSAISAIAGFASNCLTETSSFNAIKVDYSDDILNNEVRLADIKYVEIAAREGNAGSFVSVAKIDRCDLEFPNQSFIFRNDGAYSPISDEEALRAANQIPLLATTHLTVDDRSWWGGTVERYDNLDCIDAKTIVEYGDEAEVCVEEFVTIKGRVRIQAPLNSDPNSAFSQNQPIWSPSAEGEVYFGAPNNVGAAQRVRQEIPSAGFTVYLAGTPFFATTRQVAPPSGSGVVARQDGAYIIANGTDFNNVAAIANSQGIWHEFEIRNVPKGGRFILRVASHLANDTDEEGEIYNRTRGLEYQRTSTRLETIGLASDQERVINTQISGSEIDISGNEIIVNDIARPSDIGGSANIAVIEGYLFDPITDHSGDIVAIRRGVQIEGATVTVTQETARAIYPQPVQLGAGTPRPVTSPMIMQCDHNGYFYYSGWGNDEARVTRARVGNRDLFIDGNQAYQGSINRLLFETDNEPTPTSNVIANSNDNASRRYIIANTFPITTEQRSFFVEGKLVDTDGNGIPAIRFVINRTSRSVVTDGQGNFRVRLYGLTDNGRQRVIIINPVIENSCCLRIDPTFILTVAEGIGTQFTADNPLILDDIVADVSQRRFGVWKRRNTLSLGIKYLDEYNRSSKVQTDDDMTAYIPFWTEEGASKGFPTVSWQINHQPPKWATKFQIVRRLNPLYSRYLQYIIGKPRYVRTFGNNVTDTSYSSQDATEVYIPLKSLIDFNNENSGSVLAWDFTPGDRLTFMRDDNGEWFDRFWDFQILNDRVTPDDATYLVIKFDQSQPELKAGAMIELYSLGASSEVEFYYDISECYPIINAGEDDRRHGAGFQGQVQTANAPATGVVRYGDSYLQNRTMPIIGENINTRISALFESEFLNESLENSRLQSIGRFDTQDKDFGQVFFYTRQRITGRYLPDTSINSLNQFIENDYLRDDNGTEIDRKFGAAISTQFAGSLVLAVHQFKCVPIYTNATPVFDLQGGSVLTKSRAIATIAQPIREDKGSQNPESVVMNNGNVYAYDGIKNSWWRYGFNGLFDISDYEFNSFFDQVQQELQNTPDKRILSRFDRQKGELVVSIPGIGETVSFNEELAGDTRKNRWMTDWSWIPDYMGIMGEVFVSWKNGRLYVHDANDDRGVFYGIAYPCGVDFYANTAGEVKKLFKNMRIKATDKFITEPNGIEVFEGESRRVMVSELRESHVEQYEGDWWADILRDMNDPQFADIEDVELRRATALLKGRLLRGDYALVKLRNNSRDLVTLWAVDVTSFVSHKTKE